VEAMPSAGQCSDIHLNGRRILNEVPGEVILRISGRKRGCPLDSTPTNFEGVENGSNRMTQRMARIQAVWNREGIEHAVVSDLQHRLRIVKIYFNAGGRDQVCPKQGCA
jgi:hypothetical protein